MFCDFLGGTGRGRGCYLKRLLCQRGCSIPNLENFFGCYVCARCAWNERPSGSTVTALPLLLLFGIAFFLNKPSSRINLNLVSAPCSAEFVFQKAVDTAASPKMQSTDRCPTCGCEVSMDTPTCSPYGSTIGCHMKASWYTSTRAARGEGSAVDAGNSGTTKR